MTSLTPALLLGFILSTIYAALFHLWGGRTVRDLLFYWIASMLGFAIGQAVGVFTQIPLLEVGQLHVLEGSIGAFIGLAVARAWSQVMFADGELEVED
jgi:hypothetical protein